MEGPSQGNAVVAVWAWWMIEIGSQLRINSSATSVLVSPSDLLSSRLMGTNRGQPAE